MDLRRPKTPSRPSSRPSTTPSTPASTRPSTSAGRLSTNYIGNGNKIRRNASSISSIPFPALNVGRAAGDDMPPSGKQLILKSSAEDPVDNNPTPQINNVKRRQNSVVMSFEEYGFDASRTKEGALTFFSN